VKFTRFIATAGLLAVVIPALAACTASPDSDEPTVLRIPGVGGGSGTFDPANLIVYSTHANPVLAAAYDSLLHWVEGSAIGGSGLEPNVATDWEYSEGNTVLSIRIRDDVFFTDGAPLDAEAVKANIDYARTPEFNSALVFGGVEEVTVTGDHELQIRLSEPDSLFLLGLGDWPLLNPAAIADPEQLAEEPSGSGPYLLEDFTHDVSYSYVRNPDYWNPDAYPFDRVEVTFFEDGTAVLNALKSGQIDAAGVGTDVAAEAEASGLTTITYMSYWVGLILGDHKGEISPPIGNLKVRQAIYMALDRVGFAEATYGEYGNASNQIGIEGQGGSFLPERADEYAFDLEAARELLAEAGYPDGFDIDIPYWPVLTEAYQPYYDQALTDLGIRVNWVTLTDDNWLAEYQSGKYAVLPWLDTVKRTSDIFSPDDVVNPWKTNDVADLRRAIEIAGSPEETTAAIAAFNEKLIDEAWIPILTHIPGGYAFSSDITATIVDSGFAPLWNIRPAA
jgi:peptide/nickel transport system substrate-binding protein